jgi:hypothetical protein
VSAVLQVASQLPALTKLDFYNQYLTGTLPANISFPKLSELRLVNNDISVRHLILTSVLSWPPFCCHCPIVCASASYARS